MKKHTKAPPPKLKKEFKDNLFILKWISFIAAFLIIGGTFSFAMILLFRFIIQGSIGIEAIWIVGMIPMMTVVALPLSFIIYRQVVKNLNPLVFGMSKVASGDLNTYIPTAGAKDFTKIYENFNKMVSEIQSVESLRTSMLDNLSHELKTPIASINGFSKILIEKDLTEEKQKKYLNIIASESDRLDKMVRSILFLGKLDAQEIVTNKEEFSLSGQLQECIISLEHEWASKDINIEADIIDAAFTGDAEHTKSIWLNLLSNAIKFTPSGGDITVTMNICEKNIITTISDNGIGIEKEALKHIFDRRYQADTTQKNIGQGLGLAIVKRAVTLNNGKITVTSQENIGTTFTITLPKTN